MTFVIYVSTPRPRTHAFTAANRVRDVSNRLAPRRPRLCGWPRGLIAPPIGRGSIRTRRVGVRRRPAVGRRRARRVPDAARLPAGLPAQLSEVGLDQQEMLCAVVWHGVFGAGRGAAPREARGDGAALPESRRDRGGGSATARRMRGRPGRVMGRRRHLRLGGPPRLPSNPIGRSRVRMRHGWGGTCPIG